MNPPASFLQAWSWNPLLLGCCAAATIAYASIFRKRARWFVFSTGVAVVLVTLLSPLNALANGVLFSAHMTQHLLLLLVAPGLLLLSLPRDFVLHPPRFVSSALPAIGWTGGVGSMWLWHVPELCDAAATQGGIHALQTCSLLALGAAFWWPILAPSAGNRLAPGLGVAYLFTACLACTALGVLLTLTPLNVCPVFRAPLGAGNAWAAWRDALGGERDRQIGGLLMWVPMCLVYVAGIVLELFRWLGGRTEQTGGRGILSA